MSREKILQAGPWLTIIFPALFIAGPSVCDAAICILALLFLFKSATQKDWGWLKESWIACLMILWLWMLARGAFAERPGVAIARALPFIRYILFAAALSHWTLKDALTRKRFLKVLCGTMIFTAADGILQSIMGNDILLRPKVIHWENDSIRLTGPFHGQILGIMLVWLSFPACLSLLVGDDGKIRHDKRWPERALAVLLISAAVVLSGERTALVFALAGWGMAVFLLPVKKRYPLMVLASGIAIFLALAVFNPSVFDRQIFSTIYIFQHWQESAYGLLLKSDLQVASIHPAFGIGANHFRIVCPRFYPLDDAHSVERFCNLHPHNVYLEWLIEEGMVGLAIYLVFVALAASRIIGSWRRNSHDPAFIGFIIAFILRIWPLASSTGFFSHWGSPPFWLVLGALMAYTRRGPKETTDADPALTR